MNDLHFLPGCRIREVSRADPSCIHIHAEARQRSARCPDCGEPSQAVHSHTLRRPADLPCLGREVRLELAVRRLYCRNPACLRQTFVERLPGLIAPHAHRTRRLAAAQGRVGVALGGEAAGRVLQHLGMPASGDTVLRLVRRLPLPRQPAPRILGVDDWALRKGETYGTILVDLERHRVVDLLPDRSAPTLADWLRHHRGVRAVARDRSSEYARGISLGAPQAIQVADRWHLLLNLRQMIERWLAGAHGRLRRLPPIPGRRPAPARRTSAFPRTRAERAASADSRARWRALYDEVRRRHAAGEPLLTISRRMELARGTVRKLAQAESFPERAARAPGRSILDPYLAHLEARFAAGCENAMALWRELRELGFPGTPRQVHRWLSPRRKAPSKHGPQRGPEVQPVPAPSPAPDSAPALPSPKQLAWYLTRPRDKLTEEETAAVARLKQDAEAATVTALAGRFADLLRGCCIGSKAACRAPLTTLKAWLADASKSGVAAVVTFAAGLQQDGAAVKAALTTPWSSGQTEGQVNKLKLLKRQTFGRARFDLLRRRVLLAA
jgi:transposase